MLLAGAPSAVSLIAAILLTLAGVGTGWGSGAGEQEILIKKAGGTQI